jgi:hypothetical protein
MPKEGCYMPDAYSPADQIMEVIARSPGSLLEEIVVQCPNLTWNQVFLELDRLSRCGRIRLCRRAKGGYAVYPASTDEMKASA